jgi:ribulose-phosphate 3-epimerase
VTNRRIRIAPSILAADFACLARAIEDAEAAGADCIHADVMDGHFVPNITIGPPVVQALRRVTRLPLYVHLMIEEPERYVPVFVEAGADALAIHVEATPNLHRVLQQIRELGAHPGVTLNPATPVSAIGEVLNDVDWVLVLSVNPGFGGQAFIGRSLSRIARIREMLDGAGSAADLAVDGGLNEETSRQVVAAGATMLVAGTAIFRAEQGVAAAIAALRESARRGQRVQAEGRQKRSPQL